MNFNTHRSLVFGSQIIALLLVLAGLVGQRAELRSQRPIARQEQALEDKRDPLLLRARLWDDPFRGLDDAEAVAPAKPQPVALGGEPSQLAQLQASEKNCQAAGACRTNGRCRSKPRRSVANPR